MAGPNPSSTNFARKVRQQAKTARKKAERKARKVAARPLGLSGPCTVIRMDRRPSDLQTHPEGQRIAHAPRPPKPADVTGDDFLRTYAWRQLRMKVMMHHGAKCQCCGATPADGAVMNVDHIKPRKLFPRLALEFDNLQVLCGDCNAGKGNWSQTDWRQNLTPVHTPITEDDAHAVEHLRLIMAG